MGRIRVALPILVALWLGSLPMPCSAYLREFVATHDHQRVAGAEVCFYRAAGFQSAFSLFFAHGSDIGCLPADKVLDLPTGVWTFWVRKPGAYTSIAQEQLSATGDPRPEEDYAPVEVPMRDAAVLDATDVLKRCKERCEIGVLLESTENTLGTYIPLLPGEHEITVPAGLPFVPLRVVNGRVDGIGRVAELRAGRHVVLPAFEAPDAGRTDVVLSVKADQMLLQEARDHALEAPNVAIATAGGSIGPLFAIRHPKAINDLLLLFRNVPAGTRDLTLGGRFWEAQSLRFVALDGEVTNIDEPLLATPAAALRVSWTLHGAPAPLHDDSCGAAGTPPPQRVTAAVLDCRAGSAGCSEVTSARAEPGKNEIVFAGLPAGREYVVAVNGLGPEVRRTTPVARVAEESTVSVESNAFVVYGRVHRGTAALKARVRFANGEAVSDADGGSFTAFLPERPWNNAVTVRPCDSAEIYQFLADSVDAGTTLDIDVPASATTITVTESSGKALAAASVRIMLPKSEAANASVVSSYDLTTGEAGTVRTLLPPDRPVRICAEKKDYERVCLGPKALAEHEVSLVLEKSTTIVHGKIATPGNANGHLAWVNAAGAVTEDVAVTADGDFTFLRPHSNSDALVYLSRFHPLTIFSGLVLRGDEPLHLVLPTGPVFQGAVHLGDACPQEAALFGLWMDGRYVPLDLFAEHQAFRGSDVFIGHGQTRPVVDLSASFVAIALGPDTAHMTGAMADPFVLPEYRSVRRVILTPGKAVELCPQIAR